MTGGTIPSDRDKDSALIRAYRFTGVGFEFAGIVVAGVLVGNWVDRRLGTEPLFTLVMTMGAMGGALYRLLWSLKKFNLRDGHED